MNIIDELRDDVKKAKARELIDAGWSPELAGLAVQGGDISRNVSILERELEVARREGPRVDQGQLKALHDALEVATRNRDVLSCVSLKGKIYELLNLK